MLAGQRRILISSGRDLFNFGDIDTARSPICKKHFTISKFLVSNLTLYGEWLEAKLLDMLRRL